MQKHVVLVSTFPKEGSRNVGDKLIENATRAILQSESRQLRITTISGKSSWEQIQSLCETSNCVLFACLAIRKHMLNVYPFLDRLLQTSTPVAAISTGTSLNVGGPRMFHEAITTDDHELLMRFNEQAILFTTRGSLSQSFCQTLGLSKATFSGDVAFFDSRFENRRFPTDPDIRRIVISDPHYATRYVETLKGLVASVSAQFPNASVALAMHGVNEPVTEIANALNLPIINLFERPDEGLEIYDECDLHVGFRVHAHVSALNRRKPSYLLEQDGRGTDYGLTLTRRMSVPCYAWSYPIKKGERKWLEPLGSIDLINSMIETDRRNGFARFVGLEQELLQYSIAARRASRLLLDSI